MSGELQTVKPDEVGKIAEDNISKTPVPQNGRRQQLQALPPIQLEGIGKIMQGAKAAFAAARDSYVGMGVEAQGLKQDADDVTAQLRKHREDLRFEAKVGRNSPATEEGE